MVSRLFRPFEEVFSKRRHVTREKLFLFRKRGCQVKGPRDGTVGRERWKIDTTTFVRFCLVKFLSGILGSKV